MNVEQAVSHGIKKILYLLRELQDRLERTWPGERCCAVCVADPQLRKDPVLRQIGLDSQGAEGVAGNLVNKAKLTDAFKRLEEESKNQASE